MCVFQEWKAGSQIFEGYRKYDPNCDPNTQVDLTEFAFRLCQVHHDPTKRGLQQYSISLPAAVRALYSRDSLRAEDWKQLILDFDQKLLECT